MSNYLSTIENEYSRLRGLPSRLSPVDWQFADSWEQKGIPLHIVLRAMNDVAKKFSETKRPDTINSLKYFKQGVEKEFAEWQSSQVGKSQVDVIDWNYYEQETAVEENAMPNSFAEITSGIDETVEILEILVEGFSDKTDLPETLKKSVQVTRGELLALIDETKQKQLSMDDIEDKLQKLAEPFNYALIISISDDERQIMIESVNREYQNRTLSTDARAKILTKKLYDKFGLPELTLFAI